MTISSDLSKGLNQSRTNKAQNRKDPTQENLAMCFSLNSLILQDCNFEYEIFSLLYTAKNIRDKALHIINCRGMDITVE